MKHASAVDAANEPADSAQPYEGYADWKNWQGDFETSDRDARYFAAELADIDLVRQARARDRFRQRQLPGLGASPTRRCREPR